MSRLIKKTIGTKGTTFKQNDEILTITGPKGENTVIIPRGVLVKIEGDQVTVGPDKTYYTKTTALQGTTWALINNAIIGVTDGYTKILEIEGVGYRVAVEGKELVLHLGYALPVRMPIPEGITIVVEKNTMKVSGIDKDNVGRAAAGIRALKKPEPYKGKGIHYLGEVIRRKVGKKAGTAGA